MAVRGQPVTVGIARWCATHPWRGIVGWLLFLVVYVGAGSAVGTNKGQFSDFWIGEAGRAEAIAADAGLTPPPVERVLITAERKPGADAEDAARDVQRRMKDLPAVVSVAEPKAARDGSGLMVAVTLRGDKETAKEDVDALLKQTEAVRSEHRDLFVVSRIKEAVRRGIPTREAVVDGIAGSASVVTSAAVIMVSVFVSFLFIDRIEMKQIAVGLTVAVLFDAVVLRALILPSAMALLGDRCWWSPWSAAPGHGEPAGAALPRPTAGAGHGPRA